MKLYTINATPWQAGSGVDYNNNACDKYAGMVACILDDNGIDGFTIYEVQGYWQGKPERSFKIEIAIDDSTIGLYMKIVNICNRLKTRFCQDSVMLTAPDGEVSFI
jgi:hypothetical protein